MGTVTLTDADWRDEIWSEPRSYSEWEAWVDILSLAADSPDRTFRLGRREAMVRWGWTNRRKVDCFFRRLLESYRISEAANEAANEARLPARYLLQHKRTWGKVPGNNEAPNEAANEARLSEVATRLIWGRFLEARVAYHRYKGTPCSPLKLTPKIKKLIRDATREQGFLPAAAAGPGIFYSPHHTGNNEKKQEYLGPHLVWRADNVPTFADLYLQRDPEGRRLPLSPFEGGLGGA